MSKHKNKSNTLHSKIVINIKDSEIAVTEIRKILADCITYYLK